MATSMIETVVGQFKRKFATTEKVYTLAEWLEEAAKDRSLYESAAERMVDAIGPATTLDTSSDPRLGRIFANRSVPVYEAFFDFYGNEETIERIVGYFRHAAEGLEERKQILYLLGPVGGGKSSMAERLKKLMERRPVSVLAVLDEEGRVVMSPVFESPLGLFDPDEHGEMFEKELGIPRRYLGPIMSPWAVKRLREFDGDPMKFHVVVTHPSVAEQRCVAKTEPGDETNQDVSCLVGKVDLRALGKYAQDDPDAYSYSGALCRGNQGIVEFVEMFKAPLKTLHPLLTATQEGHYVGTEQIGAIPFRGIILAHSNEAEWEKFRSRRENEAFIDRVYIIRVPYTLRWSDEKKIYEKMLRQSGLADKPRAPGTLEFLAKFMVLTRLSDPGDGSSLMTKLRVYDGEDLSETDPKAKTIQEYRERAGLREGMTGMSPRFAFKVLSATYYAGEDEVAADPVLLMMILEKRIHEEALGKETTEKYLGFVHDLARDYAKKIEKELQRCYVESYDSYGQNLFDNYIAWADAWLEGSTYTDPETGTRLDRNELEQELQKIEKPAGISNPKEFRHSVVRYVLKMRSEKGSNVRWTEYKRMRDVIEAHIFAKFEEMLPVISFGPKKEKELEEKHTAFVARMRERGYTTSQIRRIVTWFQRYRKSS